MTRYLKPSWIFWLTSLMFIGITPKSIGNPAFLFKPEFIKQMKDSLQPGLVIRLPQEIPESIINKIRRHDNEQVQLLPVFSPSLAAPGITISIFTCPQQSQSCLISSFSTDSYESKSDVDALQNHRTNGQPVAITDSIQGYLLDNPIDNPNYKFYSIMWEQDGLIYTARFRSNDPQETIDLAKVVAKGDLIDLNYNVQPIASNINNNNQGGDNINYLQGSTSSQPDIPTPIFPEDLSINIIGNTIFTDEELLQQVDPILASLRGKPITPSELNKLEEIANTIVSLYISQGYFNTFAKPIQEDKLEYGIVQIEVLEGSIDLDNIQVTKEDGSPTRLANYVISRLKLGLGQPLNTADLEEQLRLLRLDPLLENVEATLKPSGETGKTILEVKITEAPSFQAGVTVDNQSPQSVGSERFGVEAEVRNLTGLGDRFYTSYFRSFTGGSNQLEFNYQVPINPMDGAIILRFAPSWTTVTQAPFDEFDITGDQQIYEISYRQPLVRKPQENFALSLGFTQTNGQTYTFDQPTPFGIGPDDNGAARTSVMWFGQDYTHRDPGGRWYISSRFNIGTGLFNATVNPPPIPDGYFFSWLGQIQRVQKIGNNHLVIVEVNSQLTPHSLLPSQQFVIGGQDTVRGYPENARAGDSGIRFSLEDRITLLKNQNLDPTLQLTPFFDFGYVWNASGNPNESLPNNLLMSLGLGLIWQPVQGLNINIGYGYPLIDIENEGNNLQDYGIYFKINYTYPQ